MIPYGRQSISTEDIEAVVQTLKSNWITQGPRVGEFEQALTRYCGNHHAVAVCNGTAALHLAMLGFGIRTGDAVIVPSLSFLASANCIEYVGAQPLFADIDPKTYNIDPNHVEYLLKKNKRVKAIIAVDFAGLPSPIAPLRNLAEQFGVKLVQDASHSLGAAYLQGNTWRKIGASESAHAITFSFHPVKSVTTGEGGAVLTEDESLASRMRELRSHGMQKGISETRPWQYQMEHLGYNYRITDFQCALGLSQLKRLDEWIKNRQNIAENYTSILRSNPQIILPLCCTPEARSAVHLYVIQCEKRDTLYRYLLEHGIGSQIHYSPIHLQPYYQNKYAYKAGELPVTEAYAERCLSIPCYPDLGQDLCKQIGNQVLNFFER